jgi:hypothetical protein
MNGKSRNACDSRTPIPPASVHGQAYNISERTGQLGVHQRGVSQMDMTSATGTISLHTQLNV